MAKPDKSKGQRDRVRVIDDEKKRALDLSTMNLVPPSVGIFDEPTRCYRINHEWGKIVMGMVSWLATVAPWRDATEDNYIGITEISRFMQGDSCDMPFQLRQNPENSCLIEQSTDGGETWLTAFDLSLCMSIVDGSSQTSITNIFNSTVQQFNETVYNNYVTNYVNSITDIAPELGYGDADDQFRDDALCHALTKFIDAVCDAAIQYYDQEGEALNDLLALLAMAGVGIAVLGLAASGIGLPAAAAIAAQATLWGGLIGVGSAALGALVTVYTNHSKDQFEDTDAREDVVCCLLDALTGANVDQDDFQGAFGGCSGLSANAEAILGAAEIFGAEDGMYAAFVENMRIGFNSAKLGLLPECGCIEPEWAYELDLTQALPPWVQVVTGTWVEGEGVHDANAGSPSSSIVNIQINLDEAYSMKQFSTEYYRSSDGSAFDNVRVIGFTGSINNQRVDWLEHDEPVHGYGRSVYCNPIPGIASAARTNWYFSYVDYAQPTNPILVTKIKFWRGDGGFRPSPLPNNSTPECLP